MNSKNIFRTQKGVIVHLGFMGMLLIAVIAYLALSAVSPETAQHTVIDPLSQLVDAVKG